LVSPGLVEDSEGDGLLIEPQLNPVHQPLIPDYTDVESMTNEELAALLISCYPVVSDSRASLTMTVTSEERVSDTSGEQGVTYDSLHQGKFN
jgi:hypothetical protein